MTQGRLRVEVTKPLQCLSKTTQTLGSMIALFTLQMHTYKSQAGCRAPQQVRLVLHRGAPPSNQFVKADAYRRESLGASICSS
jgi:hypothetical protein